MTLPETEVDRITQRVFAARNSGLDAALVKVVIEEVDRAIAGLEQDVATLTDTLTRRSEALNRTGADNDRLRAALTVKRHCRNCGWDVTPEPGDQR